MVLILNGCGTIEKSAKVTVSPEVKEESNTSSGEKAELSISEDWESFFIGDKEIAFERMINETKNNVLLVL